MAKQNINVGTAANDKKGDSLRAAFVKVNANFTELYTELGLVNDVTLSLGTFEFAGSTLSTTDSTAIVIDQATTITSNLNVGGDILPQTALGGDLGSSTLPWRSLYVSQSTIYLGGVSVGVDANGNLTVNGSSVGTTSIGDTWNTSSDIHQLTIANDEGRLITVAGTGVGVFRLPQMTANMLGAEFEFYFSIDAGQIHIQSYYTGVRETTDVFRGSIYVGVDNATSGKLHTATATTSTACDLFLGQHHAKVGSYVKVKAIKFDGVGTWMFQGICAGGTGQTPNGSDHPFQDYN
jgi:hypothetical protein